MPHRAVGIVQLIAGLAGLSLALAPAPTVPAPARPGAWHQIGAAATARPGKPLHFYRTAQNPKALGFVVTSSSSRRFRVFWWSYCEFMSDDDMTQQYQGSASGVRSVTVYPPVFDGATLCTVSVVATPPKAAKVTAAVFAY